MPDQKNPQATTKKVQGGMPSLRQLYRIGRGPSSSHTIGPEMICLATKDLFPTADSFRVVLYGSLAETGVGHGTDRVIKETFAPRKVELLFDTTTTDLPHPNTMDITPMQNGIPLETRRACSIGGGDIRMEGLSFPEEVVTYPVSSFAEIASICKAEGKRLYEYVEECEGKEIWSYLSVVWDNMETAVRLGLSAEGILPGGLGVQRKAKQLISSIDANEPAQIKEMRQVCAYAFAVSEQNAASGRIVTAPTCGAAGVLPAVLYDYAKNKGKSREDILKALATASIIGNLTKTNASVSGAECGCQAEIGTACSMAAAALAELEGLSIDQIEYAAEIAFEHQLGLTCDPICGLVQIPCIERNAVAAMRAINAMGLARFLADTRKISLDLVIETMYKTGLDLSNKYRETAKGGLAELYTI